MATGDKGGRVVIFQRDPISKTVLPRRGEYNVYSTFQSHEPEFDYLKSLEIEEKINKIRWLRRKNPNHFLLSTNDKTIKLWKVSERDKRYFFIFYFSSVYDLGVEIFTKKKLEPHMF